ncbi:hypothetical protein KAR91_06425 [Candidatus Pacearchaeota archaeon]|nr:hypothetical protein [Candidatus Pacearchaeota archaeon]
MKKIFLTLVVLSGFVLMVPPVGMADIADFFITVNVPQATGVNIVAVEVLSDGDVFGETPVTSFDFNPLDLTTDGVWLPDHYYAIDVGVSGGAGSTDITVQYTEGSSPSEQPSDNTLGYKTTASFFSVTGGPAPADQDQTPLSTSAGAEALLIDLIGGVSITPTMLDGGFFRAYVGIYAGDDATTFPEGKPFTNSDVPSPPAYTGTLTITATVA